MRSGVQVSGVQVSGVQVSGGQNGGMKAFARAISAASALLHQ